MTFRESKCPFCGTNTSGKLPVQGYVPCEKCFKEKYDTKLKPKLKNPLKEEPYYGCM